MSSFSADKVRDSVLSSDWEYRDSDTQYLTHSIHRYSGKFIPQIARRAIEILSDEGDVILDPYAGSGTTLLEASLLGRESIGIDLNPIAVLIARAKTIHLPSDVLIEYKQAMDEFLDSLEPGLFQGTHPDSMYDPELDERWSDAWFQKWFQEPVLRQLIVISHHIDTLKKSDEKLIAQVALSDILRRSSNASSRYPNVMFDKNAPVKPLPLAAFRNTYRQMIECLIQYGQLNLPATSSTQMLLGNNTHMSVVHDASVDTIVTHPPYIAAVPYAEYCSVSLKWFGYDNKALDGELTGGKRQSTKVVERFSGDYDAFFGEASRVLKPGGFLFAMVGNPTVRGKMIDLERMTVDKAENHGFDHVVTTTRKGVNRRGNNMGEEYLLFFQRGNNS